MSDEKRSWAESAARKATGQPFDPFKDNHSGWHAGPNPVNGSSNASSGGYKRASNTSCFTPNTWSAPKSAPRVGGGFGGGSGGGSGSSRGGSSSKGGGFLFLCVVGIVLYVVVHSNSRSTSADTSSPGAAVETQPANGQTDVTPGTRASEQAAKPSADEPRLQAGTPPPQPQDSTTANPGAPTDAATNGTVDQPLGVSGGLSGGLAPWPEAGVRYQADRKGFDNGCKGGTLTLSASGIAFDCPGEPGKGFSASIEQVKDVDNDGIELISKEKYHFKIPSIGDKDAVSQLFSEWKLRSTIASQASGAN